MTTPKDQTEPIESQSEPNSEMVSIPFELLVRVEIPITDGSEVVKTRLIPMVGRARARTEADNDVLNIAFEQGKVYPSVMSSTYLKGTSIFKNA